MMKYVISSFIAGFGFSFIAVHFFSPELLANILIIAGVSLGICSGVFSFVCLWAFFQVAREDKKYKELIK